jgi:hypothetical protein
MQPQLNLSRSFQIRFGEMVHVSGERDDQLHHKIVEGTRQDAG